MLLLACITGKELIAERSGAMLQIMMRILVVVAIVMSGPAHAAGVELFTPAVELGGNFGYFVCLVFNASAKELQGTVELINASDPFPGNALESWTLPPKGVFPLIRQWNDPEVFHSLACHVTSPTAQKGDLLVSHYGANSGLQCQSTVTAQ
jgi:hypothetical protein